MLGSSVSRFAGFLSLALDEIEFKRDKAKHFYDSTWDHDNLGEFILEIDRILNDVRISDEQYSKLQELKTQFQLLRQRFNGSRGIDQWKIPFNDQQRIQENQIKFDEDKLISLSILFRDSWNQS